MSFRNFPRSDLTTSQVDEATRVLTVGTTGPTGPTGAPGTSGSLTTRLLTDDEISNDQDNPTLLNNNSINYVFAMNNGDRAYYFTVNEGEYAQLFFQNNRGLGIKYTVIIRDVTNARDLFGFLVLTGTNSIFATILGEKFATYFTQNLPINSI